MLLKVYGSGFLFDQISKGGKNISEPKSVVLTTCIKQWKNKSKVLQKKKNLWHATDNHFLCIQKFQ